MIFLDPSLQRLVKLAEQRQRTALRPGTRANHRSILAKFVTFTVRAGEDFRSPSDQIICLFFEKCLETARAPATIKNYSSSLASAYRQMGLPTTSFEAFRVNNALTSIDKNIRHEPSPSRPVSPALLKRIIRIAKRLPEGATLSAAYIILFHTFLRQSNMAAPTSADFDATRQITRGDIIVGSDHLRVIHKWSKSHQSASHHAHILIPEVPGSLLCPKRAFLDMLQVSPTRYPDQPMLVFKDSNHMPATYLRRVWNTILRVIGVPQPESYTLHGLRRGAASHVLEMDPSAREAIKSHGMWRSNVVDKYLPPKSTKVFNILKDTPRDNPSVW